MNAIAIKTRTKKPGARTEASSKIGARWRAVLRSYRETARLSQAELAALAKVSQPTIALFESGDRDLSRPTWERIYKAVCRAVADRAGRNKETISLKDLMQPPAAQSLARASERLLSAQDAVIENQRQLIAAYQGQAMERDAAIQRLQERLAESEANRVLVRDLLDLRTTAAVADAKAHDLRETLEDPE